MGKATIVSELGDGLYRVQRVVDDSRALAYIASIEADNVTLDARIAALPDEITAAESALVTALAAVQSLIESFATVEPTDEQRKALDKLQLQSLIKEQELASKRSALALAKLKKEGNTKRIAYLQEHAGQPAECDAWCADLTLGATGTVGTIEIGRQDTEPIIMPGAAAHVDATDGIMQPTLACSPSAFFYNYAMLPGAAKWKPRFRVGIASEIDTTADTMTVTLEALFINGVRCEQATVYEDVPVAYLTCNARAFKDGDSVIMEFVGESYSPQVIGFENFPVSCGALYNVMFSQPVSQGSSPTINYGVIDKNEDDSGYTVIAQNYQSTDAQYIGSGFVEPGNFIDWHNDTDVILYMGPRSRYGNEAIRFQGERQTPFYGEDLGFLPGGGFNTEDWGGYSVATGNIFYINGSAFKFSSIDDGATAVRNDAALGFCMRTISGQKYIVGVFQQNRDYTVRNYSTEAYDSGVHFEAKVAIAKFDYTSAELDAAALFAISASNAIEISGAYDATTNPKGWQVVATIPWAFATTNHADLGDYLTPYTFHTGLRKEAVRGMAYWSQDGSKFIQRIGATTTFREVFFTAAMELDKIEFVEGRYYDGIQRRATFGGYSDNTSIDYVEIERTIDESDYEIKIVPSGIEHGCALGYDYVNNVLSGLFVQETFYSSFAGSDSIISSGTGSSTIKLFFATEGVSGIRTVLEAANTGVTTDGDYVDYETEITTGRPTNSVGNISFATGPLASGIFCGLGVESDNQSWPSGSVPPHSSISTKGRQGVHWADIRNEAVFYTYNFCPSATSTIGANSIVTAANSIIGAVVYHKGEIIFADETTGPMGDTSAYYGCYGDFYFNTTHIMTSGSETGSGRGIRTYLRNADKLHYLDMQNDAWNPESNTYRSMLYIPDVGRYFRNIPVIRHGLSVVPGLGLVGNVAYTPQDTDIEEVAYDPYSSTAELLSQETYTGGAWYSDIFPAQLHEDICGEVDAWYGAFVLVALN